MSEQRLCKFEDDCTILMAEMAAEIVAVWVTKLVSWTFSGLLGFGSLMVTSMVGEELR